MEDLRKPPAYWADIALAKSHLPVIIVRMGILLASGAASLPLLPAMALAIRGRKPRGREERPSLSRVLLALVSAGYLEP